MEWVIEDLTKSELQQCLMNVVLRIQKAPLQGFGKPVTLLGEELPVPPSVPAESVLAVFCNVKVYKSTLIYVMADRGVDHNAWMRQNAFPGIRGRKTTPQSSFLRLSFSLHF